MYTFNPDLLPQHKILSLQHCSDTSSNSSMYNTLSSFGSLTGYFTCFNKLLFWWDMRLSSHHCSTVLFPSQHTYSLMVFLSLVTCTNVHLVWTHTTAKFINPKNVKNTKPPTQTQKQLNNTIFSFNNTIITPTVSCLNCFLAWLFWFQCLGTPWPSMVW